MLDLEKEKFEYKGFKFEFIRNPRDMYKLLAIGVKGYIVYTQPLKLHKPIKSEDKYRISEYMEEQELLAIKVFKDYVLRGESKIDEIH